MYTNLLTSNVNFSKHLRWLHCNQRLRDASIGSPIGDLELAKCVWKCTQEDAVSAVRQGLALPEDFMVISGVSVWTKGDKGTARGIQGEIRKGNFEIVTTDKIQTAWNILKDQQLLSAWTLAKNLSISYSAWSACVDPLENKDTDYDKSKDIVDGIGEGYDEEDDSLVFKTDVKVEDLSDDGRLKKKKLIAFALLAVISLVVIQL